MTAREYLVILQVDADGRDPWRIADVESAVEQEIDGITTYAEDARGDECELVVEVVSVRTLPPKLRRALDKAIAEALS